MLRRGERALAQRPHGNRGLTSVVTQKAHVWWTKKGKKIGISDLKSALDVEDKQKTMNFEHKGCELSGCCDQAVR